MDYRNHYKSFVFFFLFLLIAFLPLSKSNVLGDAVNMKPNIMIVSFIICVLFFIYELKKSKE